MGRRIPEKDVITKLAQERTGDYGGRKLQECLTKGERPSPPDRCAVPAPGREAVAGSRKKPFVGAFRTTPRLGSLRGQPCVAARYLGPRGGRPPPIPMMERTLGRRSQATDITIPHQVSREARSAILLIAISLIDAHRFLCYIPLKS